MKNTGWDFSIGGMQSTGTVRSNVRPPQAKEKRPEVSYNQGALKRITDSGISRASPSVNSSPESPEVLSKKEFRDRHLNEYKISYCDDVSISL